MGDAVFWLTKLVQSEDGTWKHDSSFTRYTGDQITSNQEDDTLGTLKFTNLSPGRYKLIECEAPSGYHKNNLEIVIIVDEYGDLKIYEDGGSELIEYSSQLIVESTNNKIKFYFENDSITYVLPETGGLGTSTCIGMGSIMIIIGALLLGKKYLSEVRG